MSRRGRNNAKFSLFAFQDIITSVTGIMILVTLVLALELIDRKENSPQAKTEEVNNQLQDTLAKNKASIQKLSALKSKLEKLQEKTDEAAKQDIAMIREQLAAFDQINKELDEELDTFRKEEEEAKKRAQDAASELESQAKPKTIQEIIENAKEKLERLKELKSQNRVIFNPDEGQPKSPWLIEIDGTDFKVAEVGISKPAKVFLSLTELKHWAATRSKSTEYFVLLVKPNGIEHFMNAKKTLKEIGFDIAYDLLSKDQAAINLQTGAGAQ